MGTRDRCVARENLGQMRTYAPSLSSARHALSRVFIRRRSCRCTCTTCRLEHYTPRRITRLQRTLLPFFSIAPPVVRHRPPRFPSIFVYVYVRVFSIVNFVRQSVFFAQFCIYALVGYLDTQNGYKLFFLLHFIYVVRF